MQVPSPDLQHKVMIEAVENHMPETIVIDEIGTLAEALAARTIAERGVRLVGTAHGNTLDNLVVNPTLSDLLGGIQPVTLSDEEARRRGTQKTVLERKARPTFEVLVEIQTRNRLAVYTDLFAVVDHLLAGVPLQPEMRVRASDGSVVVENRHPSQGYFKQFGQRRGRPTGISLPKAERKAEKPSRVVKIYPIGVNRTRLERAIRELGVSARLADQPVNAHLILSLKAQRKRQPKHLFEALNRGVELHVIKSNTLAQTKCFLRNYFGLRDEEDPDYWNGEELALQEAEDAIIRVQRHAGPIELAPQNIRLRRSQHKLIVSHGLYSRSRGRSPNRRVVIFPNDEGLPPLDPATI
jgi:hypothetical protein